jgi:hypothetical protein
MGRRYRRRYRCHRILGLLPALVLLGGGPSLGLAQRGWLGLVDGAVFLLMSTLMIATGRPPAPSSDQVDGPSVRQPDQRCVPSVRRDVASQPHRPGC